MSIDKTTLNRIRIAIQHALCSCVEDNDDDVNYESMAKAAVDLGIIEKEEDFDTETFNHAPILFEKLWEKIGDRHYKTPLELFEAWGKDEVAIYRLGDELEDFPESALAWEAIFNALSDDEPTSNFLFVGEDFAKLYIDRTVAELNDMQREAFELMQYYAEQKERYEIAKALGLKVFGRKKDEDEEAHGKKEPVDDIKVNFNKEAWDKLKYEHDKGVFEIKLENATKNSAEIFCRATDGSYKDFEQYVAEFGSMSPMESLNLPYVVDESIRKVSRISELAEIEINTPLLMYSVYKSRYEPAKYPYGAIDVIFDIVDSMLELKKEGMIQ